MSKLTFKTEKSTGKWRGFYPDHHYIKLDSKRVGKIDGEPPHKIRFMIYKDAPDDNPNCDWKWITLRKDSKSIAEAKEFVANNIKSITTTYKIRKTD